MSLIIVRKYYADSYNPAGMLVTHYYDITISPINGHDRVTSADMSHFSEMLKLQRAQYLISRINSYTYFHF